MRTGTIPGVVIAALIMTGCSGLPPDDLGLHEGRLAPCPDSPNCVSSEDRDGPGAVAPLSFSDTADRAWSRLQAQIQAQGGHIEQMTDDYLWATWRSRLFRFVDDVEFRLVAERQLIQVRSASRLSYRDLGVNRLRITRLRAGFEHH